MLFVVIPYRATNQPERAEQLRIFLDVMPNLLPEAQFLVVEQCDDEKFNRGMLLNAGVCELKMDPDDTVCLHDVDLIPEGDIVKEYTRTLSPNTARHIGNAAIVGLQRYQYNKKPGSGCFGGVCLMRVSDFIRVNGFPNDFWAWGGEDDVLGLRVSRCTLPSLHIERSVGILLDLEDIMSHHEKMQQLKSTKGMGKGVHARKKRYRTGALYSNGLLEAQYSVINFERRRVVWRLRVDCGQTCAKHLRLRRWWRGAQRGACRVSENFPWQRAVMICISLYLAHTLLESYSASTTHIPHPFIATVLFFLPLMLPLALQVTAHLTAP